MYIAFEGIVGSGKSTQVKKLVEYLKGLGHDVIYVREPGTTVIAEDIRYLAQVKDWEDEDMHPLTNAYLYAAARAQTLHTVVQPAIRAGKIVVSDRSFLSSLAFQGEAQGLGINTVLWVNKSAVNKLFPDIVFYMDIDIDIALCRTFDSQGDKWEKMGKDFFKKIIRGYEKCERLKIMKNKFIRIDANASEDEVFSQILRQLNL